MKLVAVIASPTTTLRAELIRIASSRVVVLVPSFRAISPNPAVNVRSRVVLTSLRIAVAKEMSSPASRPLVIVTLLVSVTPVANEIPSFVLVMLPPILLRPSPFCTKSLPTTKSAPVGARPPLYVVKSPAFVTVIVVAIALVPTPLSVRLFPVKANEPAAPVRVIKSVKVAFPLAVRVIPNAPLSVAVAGSVPKSISPAVATRIVAPVRVVSSPKSIEAAVRVPALEFRLMPAATSAKSAPRIVPLAAKVIVPASTPPLPLMVRLVNSLPPTAVNVPVRLIGAVANVVNSAKLVVAASAEIPSINPVLLITMPPTPVAVRVRVPVPPPTTTESVMSKKLCVASALM